MANSRLKMGIALFYSNKFLKKKKNLPVTIIRKINKPTHILRVLLLSPLFSVSQASASFTFII